MQYVDKSVKAFSLTLNNHRNGSKKKVYFTNFQKFNHLFQLDAKFILTE